MAGFARTEFPHDAFVNGSKVPVHPGGEFPIHSAAKQGVHVVGFPCECVPPVVDLAHRLVPIGGSTMVLRVEEYPRRHLRHPVHGIRRLTHSPYHVGQGFDNAGSHLPSRKRLATSFLQYSVWIPTSAD